jgi:hypothetical protein
VGKEVGVEVGKLGRVKAGGREEGGKRWVGLEGGREEGLRLGKR